ncbi:hypothetical protein G3N94_01950 [Burkholderia sp. Ac-20353]|nr:hypothetical protein [Burkholderia sp. Ac-20353]
MYTIHTPHEAIHADTLAQVFHIFFHDPRMCIYETREISLSKGDVVLPIIRYNGILTVRQQGSAESIFTSMFEEIRDRWFSDGGGQRHVWQIPRKQWEIFHFVFNLGIKPAWLLSGEQLEAEVEAARVAGGRFSLSEVCRRASDAVFGFGSEGPRSLSGTVNGRHEVHVVQALLLDKPIPDAVLETYRADPKRLGFDLEWAAVVLDAPVLRNALPYDVLRAAVRIMRDEKRVIDAEIGADLVAALRELPATATAVQVDDRLYEAGIVGRLVLPETYQQPVNLGTPVSPLAERYRTILAQKTLERELNTIEADFRDGRLSKRKRALQVEIAQLGPGRYTFQWPNEFAKDVETHEMARLLQVLDHPDGQNEATKQVIREQFGVSLRGLNSKGRRRAIFALCGYDEAAQAEWEAQRAVARARAKAADAANDAKERALRAQYQCPDRSIITGVQHVDRAVADGFSEIRSYRHGASTRYAIVNPTSREARNLRANDGTLQYARSLLEPLAA